MQSNGVSHKWCLLCSIKGQQRIAAPSQYRRHAYHRSAVISANSASKLWTTSSHFKEQVRTVAVRKHPSRASHPKSNNRQNRHSPRFRDAVGAITRGNVKVQDFISIILATLSSMRSRLGEPAFLARMGMMEDNAEGQFRQFTEILKSSLGEFKGPELPWEPPRLYGTLRQAFERDGLKGVEAQLYFALQAHVANQAFSPSDILNQARLADLRYPTEWFPLARARDRQIHLHVGPTNSGKTYHALKRLEQAKSGIYAGPLRLLAHEVYSRLNAKGIPCNLVTGDEIIVSGEKPASLSSCTVEMVPCNKRIEVAVIDEIQMIEHKIRGWAWTQALLGLQADEIHLCGEERALPLIKEIVASMNEKLHIHRYERLSPLKTMSTSLDGKLKKLRKGDCLVVFSRREIHALKTEIERLTKKKVAVVYGSLPPETRTQQARLFNDDDNEYDILVASDAIGMGLNLSIKRIVFEATAKYSEGRFGRLSMSEIKQIAGRAGRYRVAASKSKEQAIDHQGKRSDASPPVSVSAGSTNTSLGLVTTLEKMDLPLVQKAMSAQPAAIVTAGILPPDGLVVRFANYFPPTTPLSFILLRLQEISRMHPRFHFCQLHETIAVADIIQTVKGLSILDRMKLIVAPLNLNDPQMPEILVALAECVATQSGALLDIKQLNLELLDRLESGGKPDLEEIEVLHRALTLYIWLSYRFDGIFVSRALAFHIRGMLEKHIDQYLAGLAIDNKARQRVKRMREMAILLDFREGLTTGPATTTVLPSETASRQDGESSSEVTRKGVDTASALQEGHSTLEKQELAGILNQMSMNRTNQNASTLKSFG